MLKKILHIILVVCLCTSCDKAFDVSVVRFTREGGTKVIPATTYVISIHDNNCNYGKGYHDDERGVEVVEFDWLTAELEDRTGKVTLTAKKNETKAKRKLYLSGMYADIQSSIPVIQDK